MKKPTHKDLDERDQLGKADQDFEDFEIAEEELIDAYIHNELSPDEHKLVEKGLRSSPQLVERLHFARMLAKASPSTHGFVSPLVEPETLTDRTGAEPVKISWWKGFFSASWVPQPAFRVALSFGLIFVILGGVGFLFGWMKLRDESNRLARERAAVEQQRQELEKRLAEERNKEQLAADQKVREQREGGEKTPVDLKLPQRPNVQPSPQISNVAFITLFPGIRGSEPTVLPVSQATSEIRLELSLDSLEYRRYRVTIKSATGKTIAQKEVRVGRSSSSRTLPIRVPARRLPQGDYQVHVSAVTPSGALDPVEDYSFRVMEKKE